MTDKELGSWYDDAWAFWEENLLTDLQIGEYTLKITCHACPEQYDIYRAHHQVGYCRLRHGDFRVDARWPEEQREIHMSHPEGDGVFRDEERMEFIEAGVAALDQHIRKHRRAALDRMFELEDDNNEA